MKKNSVTFSILRFKPGRIDPPRLQDFSLPAEENMTVLDALEQIRLTRDSTLMYRHCCHHASCGTCACTINGKPALACTTRVADIKSDTITLEPLAHLNCLGDLAVDMRDFFQGMDPEWANLRTCEKTAPERIPEGVGHPVRFENCIECGCCVAGCPVNDDDEGFLGPAVLAAVNNEIRNRPEKREDLLRSAAAPNGAGMCKRHLVCSRVCPSKVYPARHIADLRRAMDGDK